jgi:hypothetical protein
MVKAETATDSIGTSTRTGTTATGYLRPGPRVKGRQGERCHAAPWHIGQVGRIPRETMP